MDKLGFPGLNSEPGIASPPTTGGSFLSASNGGNSANGVLLGNNNAGTYAFGDGLDAARCNCPLTESEQQFQFVNNWTRTQGNHTIKFGADIRYAMNLRVPSDQSRTGLLFFDQLGTGNAKVNGLRVNVPSRRRPLSSSAL